MGKRRKEEEEEEEEGEEEEEEEEEEKEEQGLLVLGLVGRCGQGVVFVHVQSWASRLCEKATVTADEARKDASANRAVEGEREIGRSSAG